MLGSSAARALCTCATPKYNNSGPWHIREQQENDDDSLQEDSGRPTHDFHFGRTPSQCSAAATASTSSSHASRPAERWSVYLPPADASTTSGRTISALLRRLNIIPSALLEQDLCLCEQAQAGRRVSSRSRRSVSPQQKQSIADFYKKYEIQRGKITNIHNLGEGAFGSVMRCQHRQSKAKRAVKVGDAEDLDSFKLWSRLGRHENVVELIEQFDSSTTSTTTGSIDGINGGPPPGASNKGKAPTDSSDKKQIAVMTLCYGSDLCEWLLNYLEQHAHDTTNDRRLPSYSKILKLFLQMLAAVEHLHSNNIVHRDIKLENFLFENAAEEKLRLCDFGALVELELEEENGAQNSSLGLLHPSDNNSTQFYQEKKDLVGTIQYLAPECIHAGVYSKKSDVYALGVVLFVLTTGQFPYAIDEKRALKERENFQFPAVKWKKIKDFGRSSSSSSSSSSSESKQADHLKKILQNMLNPNVEKRYDLEQVKQAVLRERHSIVRRYSSEKIAEQETQIQIAKSDRILDNEILKSARSRKRYLNLKPNELLFHEGDKIVDESLYVIQKGQLEIQKQGVLITNLQEGAVVGEMSLLLNKTERTATVTAGLQGAQLLKVEAEDILHHEEGNSSHSLRMRALAEMATVRLSQTETLQYLENVFPDSHPDFVRKLLVLFDRQENFVCFQPGDFLFHEGDTEDHAEEEHNQHHGAKTVDAANRNKPHSASPFRNTQLYNAFAASRKHRYVYFVRSGELGVYLGRDENLQNKIATVKQGSVIGEMSAVLANLYPEIYGKKRTTSVKALTFVELSIVDFSEIEKLLDEFPDERAKFEKRAERKHQENIAKFGKTDYVRRTKE
ncbi:unnamed protein product [Amoebophrya sp. A120]|nr:unnamed protein product [Amoebophrya sp. A120]|eukprot:GSA120T00019799001.1